MKNIKMCLSFLRIGNNRTVSNIIKEYSLDCVEGTLRIGNVYIYQPKITITNYIAFITGNIVYIHINNIDMDELKSFLSDNGVSYSVVG